ncbi:acyltransferase [Pseudarthrobacter sp. AG30]|uniref:acyltransferase family protein n=1 Tax=Pseudarthrobacter sp. AG30 TaxID=2249742 RepID=UPI000D65E851|nr:acyltransferase family protein [Pseudarthrobacter sp. AG30]RAX17264.1 acyltransferase [Pseudarthrobacter sp. AG30]
MTGHVVLRTRAEMRRTEAVNATRKDIQALRALAVGLVVLNHLWPARLPGGYVGVDVFFVISGYLISKHLLGELERSNRINLGQFYSRRIRRLLPAATLVASVSLLAAWALLPFSRWLAIAQETIASVLYVENWVLAAKSVDYSAHNEAASTVQHYWSLSVEEQFYLVWPLLFLGLSLVAIRFRLRRRALLALGVVLVCALALAFCIWFTYSNRSPAYFVTPARAWEFGAGALIALGGPHAMAALRLRLPDHHLAISGTAQYLGYGLIAYSALAYNEQTFFPGFAAVVPVAGTVLVIASGPNSPFWSPNQLLSARPIQLLGDVSYSLYLWHWPLIVLAPALVGHSLGTRDKAVLLVAAVALAYLSKKFIEDPGRTKLLRGAKPIRVFAAMAVAAAMVAALCGGLLLNFGKAQAAEAAKLESLIGEPCHGARSLDPRNNCSDPFGAAKVANVGQNEAPWFSAPECHPSADPVVYEDQQILADCDFTGGAQPEATVWLVGDSHAEQWKAALYELARIHKWKLKESLLGGCPFINVNRAAFMGAAADQHSQERCLGWSTQVSDRIVKEKPDMVFVSSFGAGETIDDGTGRPQMDQYKDSVTKRFGDWTAAGSRVFVFRDPPLTLHRTSPDCVSLNPQQPVTCTNAREEALAPDPVAEAAKSMGKPNVKVLDLSDQFCDGQRCYAVIGGLQVYFDNDHAARSYIRSLVPVLSQRFNEARQ